MTLKISLDQESGSLNGKSIYSILQHHQRHLQEGSHGPVDYQPMNDDSSQPQHTAFTPPIASRDAVRQESFDFHTTYQQEKEGMPIRTIYQLAPKPSARKDTSFAQHENFNDQSQPSVVEDEEKSDEPVVMAISYRGRKIGCAFR